MTCSAPACSGAWRTSRPPSCPCRCSSPRLLARVHAWARKALLPPPLTCWTGGPHLSRTRSTRRWPDEIAACHLQEQLEEVVEAAEAGLEAPVQEEEVAGTAGALPPAGPAASGTGLVETERDRLIRLVRAHAAQAACARSMLCLRMMACMMACACGGRARQCSVHLQCQGCPSCQQRCALLPALHSLSARPLMGWQPGKRTSLLTDGWLLQGVLTPFDRLDGYERRMQDAPRAGPSAAEAAAPSPGAAAGPPAPGSAAARSQPGASTSGAQGAHACQQPATTPASSSP